MKNIKNNRRLRLAGRLLGFLLVGELLEEVSEVFDIFDTEASLSGYEYESEETITRQFREVENTNDIS